MATAGPFYPGTTASEIGPSGDNDWISTSPITADDGSEAQITAATFDAGDVSYRLKATNFNFASVIANGDTINGITVEIDRRCFAGTATDNEVRLYDSAATLQGDNKAAGGNWPATLGIATYGGAADTWAASLDSADIRSANFGVALIVNATAANVDIGVDFIRITVTYTPAPIVVTPAAATLTITGYAPTVTPSDHKIVTPPAAIIDLTGYAPSVTIGKILVPAAAALAITGYAPTVTVGASITVVPPAASLVLTGYAPTVLAPRTVTPAAAGLIITGYPPTILLPKMVTPPAAVLAITGYAPTVTIGSGDDVLVEPAAHVFTLTGYAPTVTVPFNCVAIADTPFKLACLVFFANYFAAADEPARVRLQELFLLEHGAKYIKRNGVRELVGGVYPVLWCDADGPIE